MAWYSSESGQVARTLAAWPDAPVENLELLGMLLDIAKVQVLQYAEDSDDAASEITETLECLGFSTAQIDAVLALLDVEDAPPTPERYAYAQLQQAKNLWNAGGASPDGTVGAEGFSFVPRPLDKTIRQIIRPTSGVADV